MGKLLKFVFPKAEKQLISNRVFHCNVPVIDDWVLLALYTQKVRFSRLEDDKHRRLSVAKTREKDNKGELLSIQLSYSVPSHYRNTLQYLSSLFKIQIFLLVRINNFFLYQYLRVRYRVETSMGTIFFRADIDANVLKA